LEKTGLLKLKIKKMEELHLKSFLEKRKIPASIIEAVFATSMAPKLLIDAMVEVWAAGENNGMGLSYQSKKDIDGAKRDFISFIQK